MSINYSTNDLLTTLAYEDDLEEVLQSMVMLSTYLHTKQALKESMQAKKVAEAAVAGVQRNILEASRRINALDQGISKLELTLERRGKVYSAPDNIDQAWNDLCSKIGGFDMTKLTDSDYVQTVFDAITNFRGNQIAIAVNDFSKRNINLQTFQKNIAKSNESIYYNTAVLLYSQKSVQEHAFQVYGASKEDYKKLQYETDKKIASITDELVKLKGYATIILLKQLEKGAK